METLREVISRSARPASLLSPATGVFCRRLTAFLRWFKGFCGFPRRSRSQRLVPSAPASPRAREVLFCGRIFLARRRRPHGKAGKGAPVVGLRFGKFAIKRRYRALACASVLVVAATPVSNAVNATPGLRIKMLSSPQGSTPVGCRGDCEYETYYGSPRYYAAPGANSYAVPYVGYYAPPVYAYGQPPVIMAPPVIYRRPSCGQYRYWDGDRCLDARDYRPYIGPRW